MVIDGRNSASFAAVLLMSTLLTSFPINAKDITAYPSVAYPPHSWPNVPVFDFSFWDSAAVTPLLINGTFVCGFHCLRGHCLFAVSIFQTYTSDDGSSILSANIVWSANRNNPVKLSATLQLSEDGGLILQDVDGSLVWSTKTAAKFVSILMLTGEGNLVLFDRNNDMIWQSFDHPTDTLVPGQALVSGQKLTANLSSSNSSLGLYSLALVNDSLIAYLEPDAQQVYFGPLRVKAQEAGLVAMAGQSEVLYSNGSFDRFVLPSTSASQFIRLENDGHLRAYEWRASKWEQVSDLLINYTGACGFPYVCGEYGLCSNGNCSCLKAVFNGSVPYFSQVSQDNPNLGCSQHTAISCSHSDYRRHSLVELKDFDNFYFVPHIENANIKKCKEACLKNCSCKAAIYRQHINASVGQCSFQSKIFSFKKNVENLNYYSSFAYIKVQNPPITKATSRTHRLSRRQIIAIVGSSSLVFILFLVFRMFWSRKNEIDPLVDSEEPQKLASVGKGIARFSYHYLDLATMNFSVKLGEGGFGSVFFGSLPNGPKIAVKRLNGSGHIKKSFLAEVGALESVHHANLLTLIGFCAEKSHLLLVYEYMENGSLDKWIFSSRNSESALSWESRQRIIHDVAKGLAYLHDDCNQKILHLDIKPQNILLDGNFNAYLADFGLSKLIGRDQSQVLTTMRGTPGYMAPEWSSATITEKVDVYSFGIVVLEILCGRRNVDRSQPEEDMHLLRLFNKKVGEEGKMFDLVDKASQDMQSNGAEVVKMMRVAAWCLQPDYTKRPSMRQVLNVLEGDALAFEGNLNLDLLNLQPPRATTTTPSNRANTTTVALPSILSGPR